MTDQELVKAILGGDNNALRELIVKYQEFVLNTCFKVLRKREDAEDIAQEVFLEVYRSVSLLRQEEDLSFWFYRVSLNKSINYYKRKHNIIFRSVLTFESLFSTTRSHEDNDKLFSADHPHEDLELKEKRVILEKALDSLPVNQKKAFILFHYENLSYKDISSVMEISVPSVESLIFRAKANLRSRCKSINGINGNK